MWLEAITFIILYVLHSLQVMQEDTNKHDESTIGITKGVCMIGHIPRKIIIENILIYLKAWHHYSFIKCNNFGGQHLNVLQQLLHSFCCTIYPEYI